MLLIIDCSFSNRIHQQLNADQNAALHPDCKTSFRSQDDAFKRLLRYHVFDWPSPSEKDIEKCKLKKENLVYSFNCLNHFFQLTSHTKKYLSFFCGKSLNYTTSFVTFYYAKAWYGNNFLNFTSVLITMFNSFRTKCLSTTKY